MQKSKRAWRIIALILGLLLALAFVLVFAACGDEDETQNDGQPEGSAEEEEQSNSQGNNSNIQDDQSTSQDEQSSSKDVVPGATDMTPSADEHTESTETDYEFFSNMFNSLFSYTYAAVADNFSFTVPYNYRGYSSNKYTLNGSAYATYDDKDGLVIYTPGVEMVMSNYYRNAYDDIFDISFYGDGSYFYWGFDESIYYPYRDVDAYDEDWGYYRMSYDYILNDVFGGGSSAYFDELSDESEMVRSLIGIANSFATEFLADCFFECVTVSETSFGYSLDVDFERMKEVNDSLFYNKLSTLIENAFDDDFDDILSKLENLFDEKVEDAVDAILKYGEDYGITKELIDEFFYVFTDYEDLDEFVNDFDGKNETVAEAFGFQKYEVLLSIKQYADFPLYVLLSDNDGFETAKLVYDTVCDDFDSLIHTDTSLVLNTYEDGTLISIEFESSGVTLALEYFYEYWVTLDGYAVVFFDAVMPSIDTVPIKTKVDGYIDEIENSFKEDYLSDADEYVFGSGSNYKYYATLENGDVMINYTYYDTTESVPLKDLGYFEFYPSSSSGGGIRSYLRHYFADINRWWSTNYTIYPVIENEDSGTSD